jgi:carbonic anhydrase
MDAMIPSTKVDDKYKDLLIEFNTRQEIPEEWQNSPVDTFIMAQNFGWPIHTTGKPELLIATCIEFRYAMGVPRMYAYVIRRASGRVIGSEFSVGYCMAKGVQHLLMIGHNDCGMSKVPQMAPHVVDAFVAQGWKRELAQQYVERQGKRHAISDELESLKDEYRRLRSVFPKLTIAPLFVNLYDSKLYLPKWYLEVREEPVSDTVQDELIWELLPRDPS